MFTTLVMMSRLLKPIISRTGRRSILMLGRQPEKW